MHFKAVVVTFSIISFLLAPIANATQPSTNPIDEFITEHMANAGMVGVGAAIIIDDEVVWTKGYGFADRESRQPFTPDTVLNIGSISKTFTGVAMMHAVQEGKLSLDETINTYLPFKVVNPRHPDTQITLRQLATHTSSVTDRWTVYKDTYHYGSKPGALSDFLESYFVPGGKHYSQENFADARPGTHREYSNIGAALAGYIVERVTGKTLNVYAKEHIFGPLQMTRSGWSLSEVDRTQHARLYVEQNGLTIPIALYEGTTYPDGGVRTSVADLSKFFIALLNDGVYRQSRILKKESVDEMLRFQYSQRDKPANVSLAEDNSGLFWSTKFDVKYVGHGGSDPGVKTEMLANLSRDVGVILFSNTSLSGEDMREYVAIFRELWKFAEELKKKKG